MNLESLICFEKYQLSKMNEYFLRIVQAIPANLALNRLGNALMNPMSLTIVPTPSTCICV